LSQRVIVSHSKTKIKITGGTNFMSNQNPVVVITGEVRLSYAHLFKPYSSQPDKEPKYSTTILVPKSDIATKQRIDAAINAAIADGTASKWNGVRPPIISIPVHDGDGARPSDGMPFGAECRGHWVFTASSKQQPGVVDLNIQPILSQSEVYSGIYARVSIRFFAYMTNGKKGIGVGLNNVQKLRDGEPLGGGTSAASDFGDIGSFGAQQYQAPVQQQYQQPVQQQYQAPIQQPMYQAPVQQQYQPQIDPITGKPIINGVMGL
jgi:hypothetical protein